MGFSLYNGDRIPLNDIGDDGYIRIGLSLLDIGEILDPILVCGWDILSTSIPMFRISWISHQLYKCIVCECNWEIRNIIHVYYCAIYTCIFSYFKVMWNWVDLCKGDVKVM